MTSGDYPTQSAPKQTAPGDRETDATPPDGIILCGGAGRRLGGIDKGLLRVRGEALVCRTAKLLEPLCDRLILSANRNLSDYMGLEIGPVVRDLRDGFPGPLAGIEAAATQAMSERLLVLPCDLPWLSAEVPGALLAALDGDPELDYVFAETAEQKHYLCAALHRRCLASVSRQLNKGENAVWRWYGLQRGRSLMFTGALADGFDNLNSEEDRRNLTVE
jgi:molybdopterin-guanine dinucleotide biosynthesis protein A